MKKSMLLAILAILAISVAFTSCGKKSDEAAKKDVTKIVDDFKAQVENLKKFTASTTDFANPAVAAEITKYNAAKEDANKKFGAATELKNKITPEDMKPIDEAFKKANDEFTANMKTLNDKMAAAAQQAAQAAPADQPAQPEQKPAK